MVIFNINYIIFFSTKSFTKSNLCQYAVNDETASALTIVLMTILYTPVEMFIFKSLRNGRLRMISISNSKHYYMKLKEYYAKQKEEIIIS